MKFLVATHHLTNWSGSELVTLEIVEALLERGHLVDVLSTERNKHIGLPITHDGLRFFVELDKANPIGQYDLVYAHHGMTARFLNSQTDKDIFGSSRPAFVYNHLSPTEGFEQPSFLSEILTADLVLTNSPETAAAIEKFGGPLRSAQVMPNPAPVMFEAARRARLAGRLERLLVVSNHIPPELSTALDSLRNSGITVTHIGLPSESRRVRPDDLHGADAVVTIGKTVQYCWRAGCPVYVYDHFAGPGWLTHKNAPDAEKSNFSGRSDRRQKSPDDIAADLMEVPESAIALVADCPQRFHLEHWIEMIIDLAAGPKKIKSSAGGLIYFRQIMQFEENTSRLIDKLYHVAEEYRKAYQDCSAAYGLAIEHINSSKNSGL